MGSRGDLTPSTDNGPTPETRTRVDIADNRATIVPPSRYCHLRNILRKKGYLSLLFVPENPTARWQLGRPIGCSRRGNRNMLRRSTPLVHYQGVVVRRVTMSTFESCRKQFEEPRRIRHPNATYGRPPPSRESRTQHGHLYPLYANLTELLGDVDLNQHDTYARPESPTEVQDASKDIPQHATHRYLGGAAQNPCQR